VVARSEAEADAAENKITPDGSINLASWDCQFFIYATETIPEGKELRMTLKVKAEKAGKFETQAHYDPGNYNHWQMFGDVEVTTEWKKIQVTTKVTGDQTQVSNGKFLQNVAFNLSTNTEGNVFYFDDVKLEMRDPAGPNEFEVWFNLLRHGTLSKDKINQFTNFTGRDGAEGVDKQARIVTDTNGEPALNVTSIGWNAIDKQLELDEDGNPVLDDDGNPTYKEVDIYIKENGDTVTNIDNWATQFFVTVPHVFQEGTSYRLVMWARADKDATIETQAHTMPGGYKHWNMVGQLNLTPEWQLFEFEKEVDSNQSSCQTIAFNCNVLKKPNNYYFRFDEFSFNVADVTEEERLLRTQDVYLPIPADDKGLKATIDMNKGVSVLEATSFENLVNENMTVQSGEDTFAKADVSAGCFFNTNGNVSTDPTGLLVEFDEEQKDNLLGLTVYNYGLPADVQSIDTKFRYEFNKWFYLYNVQFVPKEKYDGISETKVVPEKSNAIFDLSGRRIAKPGKGLYIVNGKKIVM